jgi:hypothetical protein
MADYCVIADVKAQIEKTTTGADVVLTDMITAASLEIDRFCRRPDGFVSGLASARVYAGVGKAVLYIDECTAISLVEVKGSPTDTSYVAWTADDWIAGRGDPETRPDFNHLPYTWVMVNPTGSYDYFTSGKVIGLRGFRTDPDVLGRAVPTVRVTASWGFATTVPATIKQACIIQVSRWYKRATSGWADAVGNNELGMLVYTKALDPDIQTILIRGKYARRSLG